jgi:hypothetical protein
VERSVRSVLVGVAALVLPAGCTDSGDEGGFGVPRQPADAPISGARAEVRGTVSVAGNGCLMLEVGSGEQRWIVWPADQDDDHGQPVLDGRRVADGDVLSGSGAEVPADALPEWDQQDSYFASFGGFCSAGRTGVVVFDDVVRR